MQGRSPSTIAVPTQYGDLHAPSASWMSRTRHSKSVEIVVVVPVRPLRQLPLRHVNYPGSNLRLRHRQRQPFDHRLPTIKLQIHILHVILKFLSRKILRLQMAELPRETPNILEPENTILCLHLFIKHSALLRAQNVEVSHRHSFGVQKIQRRLEYPRRFRIPPKDKIQRIADSPPPQIRQHLAVL